MLLEYSSGHCVCSCWVQDPNAAAFLNDLYKNYDGLMFSAEFPCKHALCTLTQLRNTLLGRGQWHCTASAMGTAIPSSARMYQRRLCMFCAISRWFADCLSVHSRAVFASLPGDHVANRFLVDFIDTIVSACQTQLGARLRSRCAGCRSQRKHYRCILFTLQFTLSSTSRF